ncbi:HPF/RaiA family ribosome-associated protein [Pleurocapsales cyanobacterium LEGE 06147]|nr:HPF/RaiA family ribosome-associated protein [Pleurocapsales cyanobacterium LEGE 06147]
MKVPAEISYREVEKTEALDSLIHEKLAKLEKFCDHISSCHVAIEKIHDRPKTGSPYRVRLDITVPPGHEIAAVSNPDEGNQYEPLEAVIRDAFEAARRQLVKLNEKQHDRVKVHPQQEMKAVVTKLFPEQGYGFLKTTDTGREIYFQRNSVANDDFDRIEIGTGVQYSEIEGEMGPQATTVQIVDKPGPGAATEDEGTIEPPLGW